MTNLALVALLSGALLFGGPDGEKPDGTKTDAKPTTEQVSPESVVVVGETPSDEEDIVNDTFSFGRSADEAPVKLWVSYAYGTAEEAYDAAGQEVEYPFGEITSQRIIVGGQINLINFPRFKFGGGAQLNIANNELTGSPFGDLQSDFGLQSLKLYGILQGSTIGIHGGYVLDLGNESEFEQAEDGSIIPTNRPTSDEQDALFFGADFDYPADWLRLFAGANYYYLLEGEQNVLGQTVTIDDGNDLIVLSAGLGFRVSFFELGASAQIRSQKDRTIVAQTLQEGAGAQAASGGHQGSIIPYVIIRPPNFPAALSVRGAVTNEYADYGYSLGGGNEFVTQRGITATLSVGFN